MMKVEVYFFIEAMRAERRDGCICRALCLFRAAILLDLRSFCPLGGRISSLTISEILGTSSMMKRDAY